MQLRAEFCSTLQLSSVAKPRSSVKTLYQPYFFCTFFLSVLQLRQTELQRNISKLHVAEDWSHLLYRLHSPALPLKLAYVPATSAVQMTAPPLLFTQCITTTLHLVTCPPLSGFADKKMLNNNFHINTTPGRTNSLKKHYRLESIAYRALKQPAIWHERPPPLQPHSMCFTFLMATVLAGHVMVNTHASE